MEVLSSFIFLIKSLFIINIFTEKTKVKQWVHKYRTLLIFSLMCLGGVGWILRYFVNNGVNYVPLKLSFPQSYLMNYALIKWTILLCHSGAWHTSFTFMILKRVARIFFRNAPFVFYKEQNGFEMTWKWWQNYQHIKCIPARYSVALIKVLKWNESSNKDWNL